MPGEMVPKLVSVPVPRLSVPAPDISPVLALDKLAPLVRKTAPPASTMAPLLVAKLLSCRLPACTSSVPVLELVNVAPMPAEAALL